MNGQLGRLGIGFMSEELADKLDRNPEASPAAKERAREARTTLAAGEVDWQDTLRAYRDDANQIASKIIHPVPVEPVSQAAGTGLTSRNIVHQTRVTTRRRYRQGCASARASGSPPQTRRCARCRIRR